MESPILLCLSLVWCVYLYVYVYLISIIRVSFTSNFNIWRIAFKSTSLAAGVDYCRCLFVRLFINNKLLMLSPIWTLRIIKTNTSYCERNFNFFTYSVFDVLISAHLFQVQRQFLINIARSLNFKAVYTLDGIHLTIRMARLKYT